jgi:hypothetical protein
MLMPSGSPSENDDSRDRSTSARQALIFVLLGPVFGVLIVWAMMIAATGGPSDAYGYPIVFIFSLVVCVITAPVDDFLSRFESIYVRAPLTAIIGATVAGSLVLLLCLGEMPLLPPEMLFLIAAVASLNTGACSLLAYASRRRSA